MRKMLAVLLLVVSALGAGSVMAQDPKPNPEESYRFRATVYSQHWNGSTAQFETEKEVIFFNRWKLEKPNRWNKECSYKGLGVRFYDGKIYHDPAVPHTGDSSYTFRSFRYAHGEYQCYDERRMSILDVHAGNVVWKSSNW